MSEKYGNFEPTDLPSVDWKMVDVEAIRDGWNYFYASNQITGFKLDKNGNYERDKDGKLIAFRTNKRRVLPSTWFNNLDQQQQQ
jgi:hypothetical protein